MAVPIKARRLTRVRTPLFLAGIGLALIAFLAMFGIGTLLSNRTSGVQSPVVIASQDIPARTPLTAGVLAVTQMPSSAIPPKAFTHVADLNGYSALITIIKGQPVTSNLVASSPDLITSATAAYLPIPQGFVALTLPTNEQQGVAGYVAERDYIDVMATVNTALINPVNPRMVTRTVFTELLVIRVGPPSAAPKQGQVQGLASSITVVISLCDAQYMEWLIVNTSLKYALLSYHDYGPGTPAPASSCPVTTSPAPVGPAQVDARWSFSKG
jgi:Flp pilus assembly protein CpaB